ncbi:VWA domain-containing protein [Streptomyces sp. NPDC001068]|uniref:vWA domain-containing protein n=1 Tax=Streptomyces sp. NPDC001068 TaxID=3364544 RepID=UPI00368D58F3
MSVPSVSPITANQPNYTISDSSAFVAVFEADINALDEQGFTLTYPDGLPGLSLSLVHMTQTPEPASTYIGRTAPVPLPAGGNVSHYSVPISQPSVSGGTATLSVNIDESSGNGSAPQERWELRASADVPATWTLSLSSGNVEVNWLAVDPVAALTVPAHALELQPVDLNAGGAVSTHTVAGALPSGITLAAEYQWSYTGAAPVLEITTDTKTTTPALTIHTPGVYEPVPLDFTVATSLTDSAGFYTDLLRSTSAPARTTVAQRVQDIVLVLDRSGSMASENRFENAKTACRVLIHLFDGLRENLNTDDRVAVIAFEDEVAGFRGGAPSSRIQTLLPLTPLPAAVAAIDDPAFDFGVPGTNTPIGDGLIAAIDLLAASGTITDQRFTIIMCTDGLENSGTTALVPSSAVNGAISFQDAVNSRPARRAVLDSGRCKLSTIALGPTADQNVLNQLANFGAGRFALVSNPSELAQSFGEMLANAQTVNLPVKQTTPTTGVPDPDGAVPAVYLSTEPDADRLVLAVTPPDGETLFTGTIQLARWDGSSYLPEPITILSTASDRATSVAKLPALAQGEPIHWRVIHGSGPSTAEPLTPGQVLAYVDLHLLADIQLDRSAYLTGDRMNLTVRIRQDDKPITGATVKAVLDAPAVGLGEQLTALGAVPTDAAHDDRDEPTWMEARIGTLLAHRKWHQLPRNCPTGGLFVDGTDELSDPDGNGNYTNTFAQVLKEGTYTWHLSVTGQDTNGNTFTRQLSTSTFAGVKVDRKATKIKVTRLHNDPSGLLAALVVITPQDARGEDLGPGKDDSVIWSLSDGTFQHVLQHQPAPVQTDGTYQRVVLYTNRQSPALVVRAAKVVLPTIDVRKRLQGFTD